MRSSSRSSLLATALGMAALAGVSVAVPTTASRRGVQINLKRRSEIEDWNAAVDERKREKRLQKKYGGQP